jgi:hypothetical protein
MGAQELLEKGPDGRWRVKGEEPRPIAPASEESGPTTPPSNRRRQGDQNSSILSQRSRMRRGFFRSGTTRDARRPPSRACGTVKLLQ